VAGDAELARQRDDAQHPQLRQIQMMWDAVSTSDWGTLRSNRECENGASQRLQLAQKLRWTARSAINSPPT
jgi:hypothetical protein